MKRRSEHIKKQVALGWLQCTLLLLLGGIPAIAQSLKVLPSNGSTTNKSGPQSGQRYQRVFYLIKPSEMQASGFTNGADINSIGFTLANFRKDTIHTAFKIYLENTTDTVSRLDSGWTTIQTSSNYLKLDPLFPGDYEWQVKTNCTGSSGFTASGFFSNNNLPACIPPTSLSTSSINNNSATLNWVGSTSASTTRYVVAYRVVNASIWKMDSTTGLSLNISSLAANTNYEWKVFTRCMDDSSEAPGSSFQTLANSVCNNPSALTIVEPADTSAIVSWTAAAGALFYKIRWRRTGTLDWINSTTSLVKDTIYGLSPGTNYEWQVATKCIGGDSVFISGSTITTTGATACYPPTFLYVDSITNSSVKLRWNEAQNASTYDVRYRLKNIIEWTTAITPMELVHSDSIVVPDTLGLFTIPFSGGNPFTYTGNGLYVAFEFDRSEGELKSPDLYLATFGASAIKDTLGQDSVKLLYSFASRSDTTITGQDDILTATSTRPETYLGSSTLIDSIEVSTVYALGNIIPGATNKVDAVIRSLMTDPAMVNVDLQVLNKADGTVRFSSSSAVNITPGDTAMVSFILPDQAIGETDSITVSVPGLGMENVLDNNQLTYLQTFTNSILGYEDASPSIGNAGCDTLEGLTLIKIPLKDCSNAIGVRAYLTEDAEGQELSAVLLDKNGSILTSSAGFTAGTSDVNDYHNFFFATPTAVSTDSFFVGILQMASNEGINPIGVQWEGTLIRNEAYYRSKADGDSMTETKYPGRLMLDVALAKSGDYVTIDGNDVLCSGGTNTLNAARINARWADRVLDVSSQNGAAKFSADQALGVPDVYPVYAADAKAWLGNDPLTEQYITLHFPGSAPINYIDIYETYHPGAVDAVYVKNPGTNSFEQVYTGTASPKAPVARINRIKLGSTTAFNVDEVKIHIAAMADASQGFNAIDAVSIGSITIPGTFDSFDWSPNGETTSSIDVTTPGTYKVTTTLAGTCESSDSIVVTAASQVTPVITALSSTTFCNGDSLTLMSDQTFGNLWNTGETTQSIKVKTAGDYYVTFDDGSGCSGAQSNTIQVSIDTIPLISISGSTEVCAGSSIVLTADGDVDSYFWSSGSISSTATIFSPGTYTVKGTDGNGCNGYDTIVIAQASVITPSITGTLAFCPGDSTELDAGDGYTEYNWSTGETSQTIYAKLAGDYTVNVKNSSGCQGSATVTTTNYASPTAEITGNLNFCPGGSTTLTAGPSLNSYMWSTGVNTQAINVSTEGNYKVVVTNTDGCKDSIDVYVGTFANPVPKITGQLGICNGASTTLTATPGYDSYSWTPGSSTTNQATISTLGLVTVNVTDANGCTGSASATTVARTLAAPVISGTLSFCAGNSTTLDAGPGYASYEWSTSETTQSISVESVATYSVTVYDNFGCSASANVTTSTDNALPVPPGPITGPGLGVCGMTDQVYSINPVSNTNFYVWFLPDGASFADNDTSSTTVKINFGPGFNGGKLTVAANNICGQSAAINPTYINVGTYAATPASISGPTNGICGPVTLNYSVVPTTTGANYTWTAPPNASITSGQGSETVSILFSAAFTNGDVCVNATTTCGGTSPSKCLTVRKEIAPIGAISGPICVSNKQAGVLYSIASVPGATSYTWTATNSATIIAGQGTTSVKIDWNTKAGSVSVVANGPCGSTTPKTLNVSMGGCGGGAIMTQNATPAVNSEVRLEPEVVANDGGDVTSGNINLQWTLGEPMVETLDGRGRMVSQGFHQPTIMVLRNPKDTLITDNGLRIIAAPNPVFSILKVHIFADEETPLNLQLTNVLGNMKLNIPVKALTNTVEIKMDNYPQGVYFLTVQDKKGKTIKVVKVLKL